MCGTVESTFTTLSLSHYLFFIIYFRLAWFIRMQHSYDFSSYGCVHERFCVLHHFLSIILFLWNLTVKVIFRIIKGIGNEYFSLFSLAHTNHTFHLLESIFSYLQRTDDRPLVTVVNFTTEWFSQVPNYYFFHKSLKKSFEQILNK